MHFGVFLHLAITYPVIIRKLIIFLLSEAQNFNDRPIHNNTGNYLCIFNQ